MSDLGPEPTDDDVLAGEHALGVLNARDRAAAEARMARDPAFAAEVETWRDRLAGLFAEIAPVPVSEAVWPRIERLLAANDNFEGLRRAVRMWRGAAMGAAALAAASVAGLVVIANQPPQVIEAPAAAPGAILNANLATSSGQPLFVCAYDPDRKALIVTSLVPPGTDPIHVHQLWLIPKDGEPHSLGMIEPGTSKALTTPAPIADLVAAGAELAVSVEKPGGSPNPNKPTGPIAASGALAKI